jgi:hypothetical protein
MLPTKFRFIWPSGFRGEDLKKSTNQKQESPVAAMFVNGSEQNVQSLERTFYRCFLPSFSSILTKYMLRALVQLINTLYSVAYDWKVKNESKVTWGAAKRDVVRFYYIFSSPCQRQCELLPSLGILLKRILKCEYLLVMYRINMLHYISIS